MLLCLLCRSLCVCVQICVCMTILSPRVPSKLQNHTRQAIPNHTRRGVRGCNSDKGCRLKLCQCTVTVFLWRPLIKEIQFPHKDYWGVINIYAYKQLYGVKGQLIPCFTAHNKHMQHINNSIIWQNSYPFPVGLRGSVINPITRLLPPFSELHTYQRQHWREEKGSQLMFNQPM